jgi:hypothetical protein
MRTWFDVAGIKVITEYIVGQSTLRMECLASRRQRELLVVDTDVSHVMAVVDQVGHYSPEADDRIWGSTWNRRAG